MPAADREHRHEPRGGGGDGADPALADLARHRLGRAGHVPARRDGPLPRARRAARRRRGGVRGRGRDPLPDARRGRHRLGRRGPRAHRVPERAARGRRHRPLGRPPDLQLRLAGGGHGRRDHARDPRRRPHLEHPEADPDPARARPRAAGVRAHREHPRHRREEALQAPRRGLGGRVPRRGIPPGGARELPRPDRLGAGRRDHDPLARRRSSSGSRSRRSARAPARSTMRSSTG